MALNKHIKEENLFLNNQRDTSDSSDDGGDDTQQTLKIKKLTPLKDSPPAGVWIIRNDLKGVRKGGPLADNPTRVCEARGCNNRVTELYFTSRFACREIEGHPIVCEKCFWKSTCPDHRAGLANDHKDEDLADNQAWP